MAGDDGGNQNTKLVNQRTKITTLNLQLVYLKKIMFQGTSHVSGRWVKNCCLQYGIGNNNILDLRAGGAHATHCPVTDFQTKYENCPMRSSLFFTMTYFVY
jgi:hypothetical protein